MASGSGSLDILTSTYKQVIDDVVKNMKEEYLNEGADTEMLEELKTLWLTKLSQSGAVSRPPRAEPPPRPSHPQLPDLANIGPASKSMASTPSSSSVSTGIVVGAPSAANHGQHQQRGSSTASVGKTLSQLSRPPPALLHVPSSAESSSTRPTQQPLQTESLASGVIQQAPSRLIQQATPTSTADSAASQVAATPLSVQTTPPVMFHPGMLATAAALQQQASQSAASANNTPTPSISTSSTAPSVMEALQQHLALGGGASALGGGASTSSSTNATAARNPYGSLGLLNPSVAALQQQASQSAASANNAPTSSILTSSTAPSVMEALQQHLALGGGASALGGGASTSSSTNATAARNPYGSLNLLNPAVGMVPIPTPQGTVLIPLQTFMAFNQLKQQQQLAASIAGGVANSPDATPTAATATNQQQQQQQRSGMSRGGEKEVHQLDGTLPDLSFVSRTRRGQKEEEDKSNLETVFLSSSSTATSIPRDTLKYMDCSEPQGLLSSSKLTPCTRSVVLSQPDCSNSLSLQQKFEPVPPSDDKLNCHGDHFSNARFEGQPDGSISDKGQSSKVILQLDGASGGLDNGSSSDDDSDAEDDSSEDDDDGGLGGSGLRDDDDDPLNSEDDVSDGDGDEGRGDFETEDTIVCQWEKVYRVKNKWKFQLKDGVMHIGGYDYVFHKTNGEADW